MHRKVVVTAHNDNTVFIRYKYKQDEGLVLWHRNMQRLTAHAALMATR